MYFNTFWFVICLIALLLGIINSFFVASEKKASGLGFISIILMIVFLFFMIGVNFIDRKTTLEVILKENNKIIPLDEIKYDNVAFIGRFPTRFNPADQRPYVVYNAGLISYNKIIGDGFCRNCDQFGSYNSKDSIYLYEATIPRKGVSFSAKKQMIFSKEKDIFLEAFIEQKEITK